VDEHLGVAARAETVSPCLELAPQLVVVVELAVADHPDARVLARHGLEAGVGEVDDRETGVAEDDAAARGRLVRPALNRRAVGPEGDDPGAVGAAVTDGGEHRPHVRRGRGRATGEDGDAAHAQRGRG
jgi:hypothetical protein